MSFYIGGKPNEIDAVSDPEFLLERVPRYQKNVEVVKDIRVAQAECARVDQNMVATGTFRSGKDGLGAKQVASGIPWSLWASIAQKDPYFWRNKKKVYKWLNGSGRVWRTGQTVIRG
jgi:hypothetical protein